jgi:hypothetical protein
MESNLYTNIYLSFVLHTYLFNKNLLKAPAGLVYMPNNFFYMNDVKCFATSLFLNGIIQFFFESSLNLIRGNKFSHPDSRNFLDISLTKVYSYEPR